MNLSKSDGNAKTTAEFKLHFKRSNACCFSGFQRERHRRLRSFVMCRGGFHLSQIVGYGDFMMRLDLVTVPSKNKIIIVDKVIVKLDFGREKKIFGRMAYDGSLSKVFKIYWRVFKLPIKPVGFLSNLEESEGVLTQA